MAINAGKLAKEFLKAKTTGGMKGKKAFDKFIKDNDVKGFSTVNHEARMHDKGDGIDAAQIKRNSNTVSSDFLVIPGASNGESYILPNFQSYGNNYHAQRAAGDMFDSNFALGDVYNIKNVKRITPGRGTVNADGTLNITQRGTIDFGNRKPIERQLYNPRTHKYGKGSPDRGPTTPEQQLAENLAADNAKLLEGGGQPVAEPPKVTPQPSQPVPDKTVTTPEPKPVDPVPETSKPVAVQEEPVAAPKEEPAATAEPKPVEPVTDAKKQAEESEQLSQKLSNVGDNSIEIEEAQAEAKRAKAISDNFQREQRDALTEDYMSLSGADDVIPNTAPKGVDTAASANVGQQELTNSEKYANDYRAKREQVQKALGTGSGKTIQDSADSAAAADVTGGPVDMTIDRAMLRQKMGGDKTTWGRKDAEEYLLNNVTKKLEDQQLAIAQNKKLTSEQRLAEWNKNKKEAEDILAEGPGVGDYFFGNKLHYGIGGAAFAAAVGSQAFGGHKSNAELYSSPF